MSDRCIFIETDDVEAYDWADVVIKKSATVEEIRAAVDAFQALPGPYKIFVNDRRDPRFLEFQKESTMIEGHRGWQYTVSPLKAAE